MNASACVAAAARTAATIGGGAWSGWTASTLPFAQQPSPPFKKLAAGKKSGVTRSHPVVATCVEINRSYGDNIASMAWGARNLISTQVHRGL